MENNQETIQSQTPIEQKVRPPVVYSELLKKLKQSQSETTETT